MVYEKGSQTYTAQNVRADIKLGLLGGNVIKK